MIQTRSGRVVYRSFRCKECRKIVKVTHLDDIRRNFCSYTCRLLYCIHHGYRV